MNTKYLKLVSIILIALSFIFIFFGVRQNISSSGFSIHDFSKGMLAGMSSVAAVVWLIFLVSGIKKSYKPKDGISVPANTRNIFFGAIMFISLSGTVISTLYSDSLFLLLPGTIIMAVSMIAYIIFLREKIRHNLGSR